VTTLAALGSLALAHAGMTALALTMDRHRRQLRPAAARPGRLAGTAWRLTGWTLLALSLWLSGHAWGAPVGTVAWFGLASAASLVLILMLPYAPALAWRLGCVTGAVGLAAALAALAGA